MGRISDEDERERYSTSGSPEYNLGVVGPLISGSSIPGVLVSEGFVNGYPLKNHITQD